MGRINTPVNQKKLTNIVIMRLKKAGIRFEIACYPNKVQEWQKKIEKDLSEVLQVTTVFTNVSKGIVANDKELQSAFKSTDHAKICLEILANGELQVSEKERKDQMENMYRDIATIVAEKSVNKQTGKQFTVGVIERALQEIHFSLNTTKPPKSQALAAIKMLKEQSSLQIERAKMRLQVSLHTEAAVTALKASEAAADWVIEKEGAKDGTFSLQIAVDPSHFRLITDLAKKDSGVVEVLAQNTAEDSAASSSNATD
jgi:ribosome maturation protein SDO1